MPVGACAGSSSLTPGRLGAGLDILQGPGQESAQPGEPVKSPGGASVRDSPRRVPGANTADSSWVDQSTRAPSKWNKKLFAPPPSFLAACDGEHQPAQRSCSTPVLQH